MINIHDIVVTNNEGEGIYFNGALESTLTFTNVTVTDNDDDGIYLSGDSASLSDTTVTITGGEISNNDGNGIYVNNLISGSTLTIGGVMIGGDENGNGDNGIYVNNASNSTINIQNENTISWNGGNGVYLCAEGQCYDTNITIDDNDIKNNGEWGVNFYYIGLDNDSSTVDISNNTIDENDAGGIYIAETGSMEDPEGTLEITIDDNDITNNAGPGIWLGDVTGVAITNNFISGNGSGETTGIVVNSATGNFAHFNRIVANVGHGVQSNDSSGNFDAQRNWWGDATGPLHTPENLLGDGDGVSDDVDYSPWCTTDDMEDCENGGNEFLGSSDPLHHYEVVPDAESGSINTPIGITVTAYDEADIKRVNDTSKASMTVDNGAMLGSPLLTLSDGSQTTTVNNTIVGLVHIAAVQVGGSATGEATVTFTGSDLVVPTVLSQTPTDNSVDVAINVSPTITFSEAMDANSVNGSTIKLRLYSDDSVISSTVSLNDAKTIVTINPVSNLLNSTNYYLWVSGATDLAGNTVITYITKNDQSFATAAVQSQSGIVVDDIVAQNSFAQPNNSYINGGWHYTFRITVNNLDETAMQVRFDDWTNTASSSRTVTTQGNTRLLINEAGGIVAGVGLTDSDIENGFGTVVSYALGNTYEAQIPSVINISGIDNSPTTAGRQVQFDVFTKLPLDTMPGFYQTNYGIQANTPLN